MKFNDHYLEQLVHFQTRGKNILESLISTSLPGPFIDILSSDSLSDHDIVSGTLKEVIPPKKKHRRKVYHYQKGEYESIRSDALRFAKGTSMDTQILAQLAQLKKNNLKISVIQDSADKHIPSKTNRSVSSVPWITPAISRKIRRKNATRKQKSQVVKN